MKPENRQRAHALLAEHFLEVKDVGDGCFGIGAIGSDGHDTPRWPTEGYALSWALEHPSLVRRLAAGESVFEDLAPAPRM